MLLVGFTICLISMYFITITNGKGNIYSLSGYSFWVGIIMIVISIFRLEQ